MSQKPAGTQDTNADAQDPTADGMSQGPSRAAATLCVAALWGAIWWGAAATIVAISITACWGRFWWVFDLSAHFRMQYLIAAGVGGVLSGLIRKWRPALLFLCGAMLNAWAVAPLFLPPGQTETGPADEPVLRVLSINVLAANRSGEEVLAAIRQGEPDVVFVLEYNDYWRAALQPLATTHEHQLLVPRAGNFGIAVYSRLPLERREQFVLGVAGFEALEVGVRSPAGDLWTFFGVHVMPPVSAQASELRNRQLRQIAERVRGQVGRFAVLGDLNCTCWSPHFGQLLEVGGVTDSQLGQGWQPSWPEDHWLAKIAIDHCLVSPDVRVRRRWLSPPCGSDHRGVFVELSPTTPNTRRTSGVENGERVRD